MVTSMTIWIACLLVATEAISCEDTHHCSDCDSTSGDCLTECDTGYYDRQCMSACSKNCRNNTCVSSIHGSDKCTDGCVQGYQGNNCNIPCDSPGGTCTECPGGCDGEYCQLGSSCVSGCKDSYYGSDCKTCSHRCKSCSKISGICTVCHPPYFGRNCEYSCDRCMEPCEFGCFHGCVPGFYGAFCSKNCSENCRADHAHVNKSTDISECNEKSGDCIYGCNDGWFGSQCSHKGDTAGIIKGVAAACFVFIATVVLALCCFFKYRRRSKEHRFQQYITPTHGIRASSQNIDGRVYDVINEADMHDAPSGGEPASYEEPRSVHLSHIAPDLELADNAEPGTTSMATVNAS